jgi:hypothetical protein
MVVHRKALVGHMLLLLLVVLVARAGAVSSSRRRMPVSRSWQQWWRSYERQWAKTQQRTTVGT